MTGGQRFRLYAAVLLVAVLILLAGYMGHTR